MANEVQQASTSLRPEIAAVDLGSNSFHMIIASDDSHGLSVIDRVREMVRLSADMDHRNRISPAAEERAFSCLANFSERLKGFSDEQVVVVGTNTLRMASNSQSFIQRAEQILGFPIEIISGIEEARLIYAGVSYSLQEDRGRRMVVDIGGGSTEVIVGDGAKLLDLESLYMGCVSYTQRFMPKGKIDKKKMKKAILAAEVELEPKIRKIKSLDIVDVIGSSGTARAIEDVVVAEGWSEGGITWPAIQKLRDAIIEAGRVENLTLSGLSEERKPVFPGGVAIMYALFQTLDVELMRISGGALREGALIELSGRRHKLDRRAETVNELLNRYHLDVEQSEQVKSTAVALFEKARRDWQFTWRNHNTLCWAAQLHEIGLTLAHSQYHKHGAYILKHMELAGFSRQEKDMLSTLVRLHRRKFDVQQVAGIPRENRAAVTRLAILLRIAVVLNRSRYQEAIPIVDFSVHERSIKLTLPGDWFESRPLTMADLEQEVMELRKGGYRLEVITTE